MSLTFTITPPKRLLRRHRPMTVGEVLILREEDLLLPFAPEDQEQLRLWGASLEDELVLAGSSGLSGRGLELSFEDGAYRLRQFTPSTPVDWRIMLDLLAALAQHLGADVVAEDGSTYTAQTIIDLDARSDILGGIRVMSRPDGGPTTMHGYVRPVTLSAQTWQQIRDAEDPAHAFGEAFEAVQRVDAFDASQMSRTDPEGNAVGVYVLGEGVDTVLPRTPTVEPGLRHALGEDAEWELVLLAGEDDPEVIGSVPYAEALSRIPAEKISEIDAASLLIEALDAEEIRAVVGVRD